MIIEQKLYARVGRSFKPIPNYVGMYWDGENWTKECTKESIARCYDQESTVAHMFFLWKITGINWFNATKEAKVYGGYLPSHAQAALAIEQCEELREDDDFYWTRDEFSSTSAWSWLWANFNSFAYFTGNPKSADTHYYNARIFFDTIIKL